MEMPAPGLRVQDLSKDTVARMSGAVRAWSGVWTNLTGVEETQGTNTVTNVVTIGFHALVLDVTPLLSVQQVQVHEVVARPVQQVRDGRRARRAHQAAVS